MDVWVLIERINQSDYTEPQYYSRADDSGEIVGVYESYMKAAEERDKAEALLLDDDNTYYEIGLYDVQ